MNRIKSLTLGMRAGALLLCLWSAVAGLRAQDAKTVPMEAFTGQSVILPIEAPDSVAIDRRDIVDYLADLPPTETRVILSALSDGNANVTVEKGGETTIFQIRVLDPNQLDQISVIKRIVGDPGLEVVFLDGDRILLEGELKNDLSYRRAVNVASAFSANLLNFMTVKDPTQIRIKTQIVEINVTKAKDIGMQYRGGGGADSDDGISGAGIIPFSVSSIGAAPYFRAVNQFVGGDFEALLSLAQSRNVARILQEPTLTVLNGQSAIFRVGGEVPIITTNTQDGTVTESVNYRPFGISMVVTPILEAGDGLNEFYNGSGQSGPNQTRTLRDNPVIPVGLNPTVYENGIIKLFVRPEISNVDFTQTFGINDAPLFTTRYVESRVALKDGQPLVIGGLYDEDTAERLQEIPFISKIPIIGELFKHRRNTDDRLELVFILTPTLLGMNDTQTDLADYPLTRPETEQYMLEKGVDRMPVKPTRISANDILVRTGDMVPVVRDLRMMEEAPGMPMEGVFKPESVIREGPTIRDFENDLPDPAPPANNSGTGAPDAEVKPSQGLPDLQPRPSE